MTITSAVQKGKWVYVYDRTRQLFSKHGELVGYTGGSVSVKNGNWVNTYDEKGRQISVTSTR